MKKTLAFSSFLLASSLVFAQPTVQLVNFSTGFDRPVDIAHCGDERLFIVEQDGVIWILDETGTRLPEPFLDIKSIVGSDGNEQGLLGLAFHPNYATNGYFFVNYTDNDIDNEDTHIARFSVSVADPNKADPASEKLILFAEQPFSNHNGGCLKFGPDGYLYIGLGDGGSGNDPQNNGQKRTTFLGKMLRINVDSADTYSVPTDNPFVNQSNTLPEIWALGLRNPWRFSFDRATGDLWIGDVGQDSWEEIDFQPANSPGGENYGWRCYEGSNNHIMTNCEPQNTMTFPVAEYQNSNSMGCSVTGGFVYRGCEFPALYGRYLFTDYCTGRIWATTPDDSGGWETEQIADLNNNQFVSFGENSEGELFLTGLSNGIIYQVTSNSDWVAIEPTCQDTATGVVEFSFPEGDQTLQFIWNDGSTHGSRQNLAAGEHSVTITYGVGCIRWNTFLVEEYLLAQPLAINYQNDSVLVAVESFENYQWLLNGVPISGATAGTFVPTMSGEYNVRATTGECTYFSNVVNVIISAAPEVLGLSKIMLSPNPFGDALQLKLATPTSKNLTLRITDANGKAVFEEKITVTGTLEKSLDLRHLPGGVFWLTLKTDGGEWSERIVKQN